MLLFLRQKTNGATKPWEVENLWCFDVMLCWSQWLIGASRFNDYAGVVWTLHIGPLVVNYYRAKP